jgi:endonuclease/exonuclease/phosphatase family metal-dependent hydrolase
MLPNSLASSSTRVQSRSIPARIVQGLGLAALLWVVAISLSCGGGSTPTSSAPPAPPPIAIPPQGSATTLDIAEWNLEWFGETSYGPANESLQQQNVREVIAGVDCDIWGLEEVVSGAAFGSLVTGLPGYAGLLASDASVTNGSAYYGATEQKVALLYKTSLAAVQSAQIILTANDYDFAGRPPMEVKLSVTFNGASNTVYVICLHAKAMNDTASWQRRFNASAALKTYLDTTRAGEKVFVMGDFNDDFDTSITSGKASPYQNFVDDPAGYFVPTKALSDARIATTLGYPDAIDHHLVTHALAAAYVASSAQAFPANLYVTSYATTTTDHLPVITRWNAP